MLAIWVYASMKRFSPRKITVFAKPNLLPCRKKMKGAINAKKSTQNKEEIIN